MKINSLDDLNRIKEEQQKQIPLRQRNQEISTDDLGNSIEILVGMATCGISAGAKDTFYSFQQELARQGIPNASVIPVGCVGHCHSEPTVQVNIKGQEPVLYGHVNQKAVQEIVQKHIKDGKPVENLVLDINFVRT